MKEYSLVFIKNSPHPHLFLPVMTSVMEVLNLKPNQEVDKACMREITELHASIIKAMIIVEGEAV